MYNDHHRQPLLESDKSTEGDHAHDDLAIEVSQSLSRKKWQNSTWTVIHVCCLAFYTALFLLAHNTDLWRVSEVARPYSPAHDAVQYRLQDPWNHHQHSPFIGEPGIELDQAWSQLMYPTVIRLSEAEMRKLGQTTVGIRNGGYFANLEVYHQLHCVKRMKQWKHYDYYFSNLTAQEQKHLYDHYDHCIEVLRRGVMCSADTSINTFEWEDSHKKKPATMERSVKKCVDWERLDSWARDRATGAHPDLYQFGEDGAVGPR